jgi:hypothetical protein
MRLIIFLILGVAAAASHADSPRSYHVQLSSRDRAEISRLACINLSLPKADSIDASKVQKTSSLISVRARCGSHRVEGSVPVAHVTRCDNQGAKWSCETGHDALTVVLPDKGLLTVVPDGMSLEAAASVMTQTITLTIPPFYRSIVPLLIPQCTLRQDTRAPFKGATLFRLACTNWDVEVTRDCGVRPCRHFVVRTDPKPAQ